MLSKRWDEIKDKLDAVLELEPPRRSVYLQEIAAADPELCQELKSLIASHENAGTDFLNTRAREAVLTQAALSDPPSDAMIGCRIGTYEIAERIGAGGMGEVYRAFRADDQYRKQVAIKLVRAGHDSDFVVRRFKNERQILASLDHPNIARLLDGGTTERGAPYFVMELIEGQPIDEYCDSQKLPTGERLKLFSQVCSAVQYAHQYLIIHRDIKPSNILVTSSGVPKLLDFGIAKILDADAASGKFDPTQTLFRVLTPGYASPEQIKGEPITTASDVYSLGVVLYELLTGRRPYRAASDTPHEVVRAVCEFEPEKPSIAVRREEQDISGEHSITPASISAVRDGSPEKLRKRLSGDLDNIVLMALRKEPQRRYSSVEQFGEDIRRHLEDLPVVARKDTAGYRTSKFISRHKAGVAAAVAVILTLLVGMAGTLREAHIARQQAEIARTQRARAEQRFIDVRKLANSLIFEIHDSIKDLPGTTPARKLLVTRALEYLDSLSKESSGDSSLQRELAGAYDRVGDVLGNSFTANLGDPAGALQSYRKALAIRESLAAANPKDVRLQIDLYDEYFRIANSLEGTADLASALSTLKKSLPLIEGIAWQNDPEVQSRLAGVYWFSGQILDESGDFTAALESYRKGASIRQNIVSADPRASMVIRTHLAADYNGIARMLMHTGDLNQAVQIQTKARDILKQLCDAEPANATLQEYLAEIYIQFGLLLERRGDKPGSLENYRKAHEIFGRLMSEDPTNSLAQVNVGDSDLGIGRILIAEGRVPAGLKRIRDALSTFRALASRAAGDRYAGIGVGESYSALGLAYSTLAANESVSIKKMEDWHAARSWYQKSLEVWREKPNRNVLDHFGQNEGEQVTEGMARCDAALAKLNIAAKQ
jgi:serine/threonine protein kinase/tetratricopeptide (TPR) repeat protein